MEIVSTTVSLPSATVSSIGVTVTVTEEVPAAIVTEVPGTTRDMVTEVVDLHGMRVTLVDTAGIRDGCDEVELAGVERSRLAIGVADLVLLVVDGSSEATQADRDIISQTQDNKRLIVINKSDLPIRWSTGVGVSVSAVTGSGLDELRLRILDAFEIVDAVDRPEVTNVRHVALIQRARDALWRAANASRPAALMPEEFVLADLQDARSALEEITGKRAPESVLDHIFERFCIGK